MNNGDISYFPMIWNSFFIEVYSKEFTKDLHITNLFVNKKPPDFGPCGIQMIESRKTDETLISTGSGLLLVDIISFPVGRLKNFKLK